MSCPGVYIMTNVTHTTLYVGVSMLVPERVNMHREGRSTGFAAKYRCTKLVYYEILPEREAAYAREKELKGWSRMKKEILIQIKNPHWKDLYDDLVNEARELM